MEKFAEKRYDYFERLEKYRETIKKLAEDKKNKMPLNVLLTPKDEKELEFANTYLNFLEDSILISINAVCENLEEIDPENSLFVEFISNVIKAIYDNAGIEEQQRLFELYKLDDCETLARLLYEMCVLSIKDPATLGESICARCGIDVTDKEEYVKFSVTLQQLKETGMLDISFNREEDFDKFISFANYYHMLYINGIIDPRNQEVEDMLITTLAEDEGSVQEPTYKKRIRNINDESSN